MTITIESHEIKEIQNTNQLIKINPVEFDIEPSNALNLTNGLSQVLIDRSFLEDEYNQVIQNFLNDKNDKSIQKKAKELRLKIVSNRTKGIVPWHKKAKEVSLRMGQFLDAVKRSEEQRNTYMEQELEGIELYHQKIQEEQEKELHNQRLEMLLPFISDLPAQPAHNNLALMNENDFCDLLEIKKKQFFEREAERKAQEELAIKIENARQLNEFRRNELLDVWHLVENKSQDFSLIDDDGFLNYKNSLLEQKEIQLKQLQEAQEKAKQAEELAKEARRMQLEAQAKALEIQRQEQEKARQAEELARQEAIKKENELNKIRQENEMLKNQQQKTLAEKKEEPIDGHVVDINDWIDSFELPKNTVNVADSEIKKDIIAKFAAFKNWAKKQVVL